jgi:glycosyltransferase involved in cell wall biosynthesis
MMKGKRLLMIINFFPPAAGGGVYRPLSFVKYLSRSSWEITVVTPRPGEFWISDPELEDQIPDGVRVVRTGSLSGPRALNSFRGGRSRRSSGGFGMLRSIGEIFLVPDTYVGWIPFASRAAERLCREGHFDLVYSTSPPDSSHLVARRISRRFGLPWIADFRDPWIALHLRRPPTPLHVSWHRRLERGVMGADAVLVTTQWHGEMLRADFPGARIEQVPNGFDEEDFEGLEVTERPSRPFTILHGGMLTLGRSIGPFLEGLSLFIREHPDSRDDVRVTFLGGRESRNEELAVRAGLGDIVSFEDNVSHAECVRRECSSHVLLLLKHDDDRYRGLVPGKLYEYLGARRPILAVVPEGEAADIVRGTGRGEVTPIGDARAIADGISKMHRLFLGGSLDGAYTLTELPDFTRSMAASRLDGIMHTLLEES